MRLRRHAAAAGEEHKVDRECAYAVKSWLISEDVTSHSRRMNPRKSHRLCAPVGPPP
jgi:hypothetical protein